MKKNAKTVRIKVTDPLEVVLYVPQSDNLWVVKAPVSKSIKVGAESVLFVANEPYIDVIYLGEL